MIRHLEARYSGAAGTKSVVGIDKKDDGWRAELSIQPQIVSKGHP